MWGVQELKEILEDAGFSNVHTFWEGEDDDGTGDARPARFDSTTDQWIDLETGDVLTANEINSLRHYQMAITYDDRVRTQGTQPPGLPKGKSSIFGGLRDWEELSGH